MPRDILMPALSPTMTEGRLLRWCVRPGARVAKGAPLAEIETDKAVMEFDAPETGIITELHVPEGPAPIPVHRVIARLDPVPAAPEITTVIAAAKEAAPAGSSDAVAPLESSDIPRVFASPRARRLAAETGRALAELAGTGPGGRIIAADLEASEPARRSAPTTPPLDPMRRAIAARVSAAQRDVPQIHLRRRVTVDALLALRDAANATRSKGTAHATLTACIARAAAMALRDHPRHRAIWAGDRITRLPGCDIAVAVAHGDDLTTPVLRAADEGPLARLAAALNDTVSRARARRLTPAEMDGGSFILSNLGMFDVESFDGLLTPPRSALLSVGACRPVARPDGAGGIDWVTQMALTLTLDHRVIDGAPGARLLAEIARNLEEPERIFS
ncbi:dihydrolipoamide acetyltransferase family protein [Poseidonocella sedimentorum]|uniref:Dihydrolipoamide acetyltransferase component of pyruvate dehydrogenase complex n=1 Tax=Poseidonocella sedimentorum TaxID=871652 RepID=A0A1I6DH51_9RHOB|nr:dihydrolipoamide acetyltransferase family protein [Poseidonocella sedimentorum]SFR04711.1 pyruvate dehydrogenase E2 component (dihydrolipoamide acetyltransferase) [Poseidonocella sedimentorum]